MLIDCRKDRPPGLLLVLVGPSGVGKTSLVEVILRDFSGATRFVTSTTRPPRPGEESGCDYHFLGRDDFERRAAKGEFLEWQEVYENLYGTSRLEIERLVAEYAIVVAILDIRGALIVKDYFGETTLLVGLWAEREDLERRLLTRGDTEDNVRRRLGNYDRDMESLNSCDVCLNNSEGGFEKCTEVLIEILRRRLALGPR